MKTHNLKFTDADMQILQMALGEIPFKFAAPLIDKISAQLQQEKVQKEYDSAEDKQSGLY